MPTLSGSSCRWRCNPTTARMSWLAGVSRDTEGSSLQQKDGSSYLKSAKFEIKLTDKQIASIKKVAKSDNLAIGIRPEDVKVAQDDCTIGCEIEVVENMGSGSIFYFRVGDERIVATTERVEKGFSSKGECRIGFNLNKLHVFDRETEIAAF